MNSKKYSVIPTKVGIQTPSPDLIGGTERNWISRIKCGTGSVFTGMTFDDLY